MNNPNTPLVVQKEEPYAWENLRLGQLLRLVKMREYGPWTPEAARVDPSTLNRDIVKMVEGFRSGDLTNRSLQDPPLTVVGDLIASAFQPALALLERISAGEIMGVADKRCFRIGSGGSLAVWLIGSQLRRIRSALNRGVLAPTDEEVQHQPRIQAEVYRNRVTVVNVSSGALDCGLVRKGVTEDGRLRLKSAHIGTVRYCLYIPRREPNLQSPLEREIERHMEYASLPEKLEQQILEKGPLATVGPDGEFAMRLKDALADKAWTANIELLYRAFPMLVPNMQKKSHVLIMPDISALGGVEPEGFLKFRLGVLDRRYSRDIFLVVHQDHEKRTPWMDYDALVDALRF